MKYFTHFKYLKIIIQLCLINLYQNTASPSSTSLIFLFDMNTESHNWQYVQLRGGGWGVESSSSDGDAVGDTATGQTADPVEVGGARVEQGVRYFHRAITVL